MGTVTNWFQISACNTKSPLKQLLALFLPGMKSGGSSLQSKSKGYKYPSYPPKIYAFAPGLICFIFVGGVDMEGSKKDFMLC